MDQQPDQEIAAQLAAACNESQRVFSAMALTVAQANQAAIEMRNATPEETRRELLAFFDSLVTARRN